jgi:hypothetical protein
MAASSQEGNQVVWHTEGLDNKAETFNSLEFGEWGWGYQVSNFWCHYKILFLVRTEYHLKSPLQKQNPPNKAK